MCCYSTLEALQKSVRLMRVWLIAIAFGLL